MIINWSVITATGLAAAVEWVEAFTIVLAVALQWGWLRAASGALAALILLVLLTVASGGALVTGMQMGWVRGVIGALLILFGLRWLAKAVARQAGLRTMRDEEQEFTHTQAELVHTDAWAAWLIAFKGVLLEGLEVWLVVVTLGTTSHQLYPAAMAAIGAGATVTVAGLLLQAPLRRVPENAIKLAVGAMILSFGTFWGASSLGAVWPLDDGILPILIGSNLLGALFIAGFLRRRATRQVT